MTVDKRVLTAYEKELLKDLASINDDKERFANDMRNSLGAKMSDINTYIVKEPSIFNKIITKIKLILKFL